MKAVVALSMGFFSGLLIYFLAAMTFLSSAPTVPPGFVFVTFFGGWIASSYLMLKGAISTSKVFSRGFLIGAAEWLAFLPVGFLWAGKTVVESSGSSTAQAAGATIGGGLIAFLTGGLSIGMALFCLIGFAISYSLSREMKPESAQSQTNDVSTISVPQSNTKSVHAEHPVSSRTLYDVIGVPSTATAEEITHVCLQLAPKYIDDSKAGSLQAALRLKEIEQAFEILGDPDKRRRYDAELRS